MPSRPKFFPIILSLFLCPAILFFASSINKAWAESNSWDSSLKLTLMECYALALKQSEKIAIQQAVIKEAEGRFLQSLSGALPKASFSYTDRYQDGASDSNFTLGEVPEAKFVFSQPLFSGFKEFAAIAGSRYEKEQRRQEKKRAEQLLFTDVADAFYFLFGYQEDLGALRIMEKVLGERVDELNKRVSLGRSRESEVASAEARLSSVEADIESLEADAEVGRELLEFLTGRPINALDDTLTDLAITSQEDYLERTMDRPDILAARNAWEVAKKQTVVARSSLWPTVGLDGNYYTKRVGNSAPVDWDMTLNVDVPIFQGGENIGKVKEAKAQEEEARLLFEQSKRQAELEIRNDLTRLEKGERRVYALTNALKANEKNYGLQLEDYKHNLVNNLDVLQALEDLQSVRRDLILAISETKRLYWKLQVAVGEIPHGTR